MNFEDSDLGPERSARTRRMEAEILDGIPLTRALALRLESVGPEGVELRAPWEPNRNGHGSLFGGSAIALALVAGWALVRDRLHQEGVTADVVIQDLDARFDRPILGDVRVRAHPPDESRWNRFRRALARRGRGRVSIRVELCPGDGTEPPTVLEGRFVALLHDGEEMTKPQV